MTQEYSEYSELNKSLYYDSENKELIDKQTGRRYISYECSICGSKLICSEGAWKHHYRAFPESKALCNGFHQDHILSEIDCERFSLLRASHPITIMVPLPINHNGD